MIAYQALDIMYFSKICPISRIVGDHLGFCPSRLEIIFRHGAAMTFGTEGKRTPDAVLRVRCRNRQHVAKFIKCDLLFYGVDKFATDLIAGEVPLNFNAAETFDDFFIFGDQLGLFIAEVKTIPQT